MSGKKQHIIPQMIQMNFCDENKRIHVYKKDKNYPTNIVDNFCENYYYSTSVNTSLDDAITEYEANNISRTLRDLKSLKTNSIYDLNKDLENFIFHMIKRNKMILKGVNQFLKSNDVLSFINTKSKNIILDIIKNYQSSLQWTDEEVKKIVEKPLYYQIIKEQYLSHMISMESESEKHFHWGSISNSDINRNFFTDAYKFQIFDTGNIILPLPDTFIYMARNDYIENSDYVVFPITSKKFIIIFESILPIVKVEDVVDNLISAAVESFIVARNNSSEYFASKSKKINTKNFAYHIGDLDKQDFLIDFFNNFRVGFEDVFANKYNLKKVFR